MTYKIDRGRSDYNVLHILKQRFYIEVTREDNDGKVGSKRKNGINFSPFRRVKDDENSKKGII
jgi:hypothetical protein